MTQEIILQNYLSDALETFEGYKLLAEKSFAQISDDEFFRAIDAEANSVAVVAKHLGGNLRSRWRDFLISDGEKPDRNRDSEFVTENETRANLTAFWNEGWQTLFNSLRSLQPEDLGKIVKIRGEDFTVVKAINRALTHAAYHVGQIVFLAKHFRAGDWQTLSVPRNQSGEFNNFLKDRSENSAEQLNHLEAAQKFVDGIQK